MNAAASSLRPSFSPAPSALSASAAPPALSTSPAPSGPSASSALSTSSAPAALSASASQTSFPRAALDPSAPIRIGVLVNPRARGLGGAGRSGGAAGTALRDLRNAAGEDTPLIETGSVDEVAPAIARLVHAGVNVIAVAGGDGTLNQALEGPIASVWPGAWMLLGGGTLNIVARQVGSPSSPSITLATARERWSGRVFGQLVREPISLLQVSAEGMSPRHGFVFGSEMVKNALELYDRFGGGYSGLSRFLFEVGRGYTIGSSLWRAERWRLAPPSLGITVETASQRRDLPVYSAAIASTVDLAIGNGSIRALTRKSSPPAANGNADATSANAPRGFLARVIEETQTGPLIGMIPALMRGGAHPRVFDADETTTMELHGAYTLDGECFGTSTRPGEQPRRLSVKAAGAIDVVRAG